MYPEDAVASWNAQHKMLRLSRMFMPELLKELKRVGKGSPHLPFRTCALLATYGGVLALQVHLCTRHGLPLSANLLDPLRKAYEHAPESSLELEESFLRTLLTRISG